MMYLCSKIIEFTAMLFIETDSPPPFYQEKLTPKKRKQLDEWFIGHRTQRYYMKRFEQFDKQGYLSPKWHWAAFFITFPWLLYRKRYMDAIVYSVAGWSFIQLNVAIVLVIFEFVAMSLVPDAYQMATRIGIAGIIWVFWSAMVARWTDAYYYRMARREIADALEDNPRDDTAQKAHLKREGGVSLFGLGLGFGFFGFSIMVIYVQFLPIIAKPRENAVIFDAYDIGKNAQNKAAILYEKTGRCPTNLSMDTDNEKVTIRMAAQLDEIATSDCAIVATIQNVQFPIRYLDKQKFIFYHNKTDGNWRCTTSLSGKQAPVYCADN